jgi:pyruvate dehydrogenase E2 component (dihydrolipoamide acetyltransferase)
MKEIKVPDIGDFSDVDVIEVLVAPGDLIALDDALLTLESDKASMEVPASEAGVVKEVRVSVGDKVSEGTVILLVEATGGAEAARSEEPKPQVHEAGHSSAAPGEGTGGGVLEDITVPDIGDFNAVDVIEVLVAAGDTVGVDEALITLESDKASMEVPSPRAGVVKAVKIAVGDKVSEGDVILTLASEGASAAAPADRGTTDASAATSGAAPAAAATVGVDAEAFRRVHASPSVRRIARELGADLTQVTGTGLKGRVTKGDVEAFQAAGGRAAPAAAAPAVAEGMGIPPIPAVDFSKFGETEEQPLGRIKKISGPHLHRSWLNVPMVTHHDEADVTDLEAFRKSLKGEAEKKGVRITLLAFVTKALGAALQAFPSFNASLSPDGTSLILKKYVNVGIAVDTPNGLMVPVIKGVDGKGVFEIAADMGEISKKARDGKLGPADMSGGCMSISSLGGIGGIGFTPLVNAPEVAILGLTRGQMKPIWNGTEFVPRLMQPMDVTYDHRVIDGAEAARFTVYLGQLLSDMRRLLL